MSFKFKKQECLFLFMYDNAPRKYKNINILPKWLRDYI